MRAKHLCIFIAGFTILTPGSLWAQSDAAAQSDAKAPHASQEQQPVAPKQPAPPPSVTIIEAKEAHGVLGRHVRSPANEDMGHIVDVIVDRAGAVRAAVIDFGGFLGVGSRKIVVDWNALHFGRIAEKADSITLELTKDQVTAAPEYKEDQPIVVLGAAGSLKPLQFDR
jgi:PRC-barrel domain